MDVPVPANEDRRLARLRAMAILDTEAEPLFDALTEAAARVAEAPVALVSLIDAERQWFKSRFGYDGPAQTTRDTAFCAHTILGAELLEVGDTRSDPRFVDYPAVAMDAGVRFYAGMPLMLEDGLCMGALCVLDHVPRQLTPGQREALAALGHAAAEALTLRQRSIASERDLDRIAGLAGFGGWQVDLETRNVRWSEQTCRIHELPVGYHPTVEEALGFYPPEGRALVQQVLARAIDDGTDFDLEVPLVTATGRNIWVRAVGGVDRGGDGRPSRIVGAFQDVSIRRQVVTALEVSERRFRKLFQYSMGLICTHDHEGVVLSANPAIASSLGYNVGDLLGRPITDFMSPDRHADFAGYLARILRQGSDAGIMQLLARDGTHRVWQYNNVLDDESDDPYILGHAQDITERFQMERKLMDLSLRDPLTGCYNRRFLGELSATGDGATWGCIAVDLDHFKQVNDTYGHQRGDEVLVEMVRFLTRHVRQHDAVVRLGGDEFLVLVHAADPPLTAQVAARMQQDRANAPIAFTMGLGMFGGGVSLEQALADADRRLYEARSGRRPGG